ncbi:DUF294 nucleotidyltransferase-like domain-containing protein [Limibacillus halophilus]
MAGKLFPSGHTPLIALPALVLDLETTGLDVRSDRVVQIGALAMEGARFLEEETLELLVDPQRPIPPATTRVHGISDDMVQGKEPFPEVAHRLLELLQGRVVVGHHIAFDLAVLRHEAARAGLPWHEPPALDVGKLLGALQPGLPDTGLETVTSFLGVAIEGRHTAMGDCLTTAQAWARLLELLREADLRTLAEAQAFAQRRDDLLRREVEAGWHSLPGQAAPARAVPGLRVDSFAFQGRLSDHMSAPVTFVAPEASLREAAALMVEKRIGALLAGAEEAPPEGILTERDLLRVAADPAKNLDELTVRSAMSSPVETMVGRDLMYRALGRMDRLRIRHICVVDEAGLPIGMISQRDLLDHRARGAVMLGDALKTAKDLPGLASAYAQVPQVAERLVAEDLTGPEVARVISQELRALTARAAELAMAEMEAKGKGPAPARWCLFVLGSGGRGESLLGADQDNAVIHEGDAGADAWFAEMGESLATSLDACGVPLCKGGIMVKNKEWRGTRQVWRERVEGWLSKARPEDLLNVDIFFDMAPAAGDGGLAWDLQKEAIEAASGSPPFLALLAQSVQGVAPRVGFFGGLPSEEGRVDLKREGLLPLVSLARTLALRAGAASRATPERLRDAAAYGNLPKGDAEALIELHEELLTLVLRQQLADLQEGVRPSGRVALKELERHEQRRLTSGLKRLETVVGEIRSAISR